ncbi:MAG: hypothetical protein WEA04_01965 [Candidatus Andersenbacteria bacterium]
MRLARPPFHFSFRALLPIAGTLALLIGAGYLASYAIWQDASHNTVTALTTGWGDLFFHIRVGTFLAEQGWWPQESFVLSGESVGYAFAADLLSGWLWRLGLPTAAAFSLPTIVLAMLLVGLCEWLVWKMTKSWAAAIISTLLFVSFGGLSGWLILAELRAAPTAWTLALRNLPHGVTAWHEADMVILNPFIMMLHQRAYLLGFPLFVGLLYVSWRFFLEKSYYALVSIIIGGLLLAFLHPFTWAAFLLIWLSWLGWMLLLHASAYTKRELAWIAGAALAIGLGGWYIISLLQPSAGAASLGLHPGWLAPNSTWPIFWFKNIGLYILLAPVATVLLLKNNRPLAALVLSSLTPFVAANLFRFAPWDWDNTKIFAPGWLIIAIAVGTLLGSWWQQKNWGGKLAVMLLLPVLGLSGGLEIMRAVSHRTTPLLLTTPTDEKIGAAVRSLTQPNDVVLTAPSFNHPVFVYAGRPSFLAYEGWLWSQGWQGKYEERLRDSREIFSGGTTTATLLQKNNITIVVIGPPELQNGANKPWFDQHYPRLLTEQDYSVYRVAEVPLDL